MFLTSKMYVDNMFQHLDSYVNHTFLVRELPDEESGTCNPGTSYAAPSLAPCKTVYVTVNDHDDQVIHIMKDLEVEVEDSDSKARIKTEAITSKCQAEVKQQIQAQDMSSDESVDAFVACAGPIVTRHFEESNKEIKEQASLRTDLASQWEDYTCADFDLPTTT